MRLLAMSGLATAAAVVSAVGVPPPGAAKMPVSALLAPAPTASPVPSPLPVSDPPAVTHLMPPTGSLLPDPARTDTSPSVGRQATLATSASKPDTLPVSKAYGDRVTLKQTANIRSAPSNMAAIVRTAPQGTVLKLFAKSAGWLRVGDNEPWGWVFAGLVEPSR
jgi:hypothetical protein